MHYGSADSYNNTFHVTLSLHFPSQLVVNCASSLSGGSPDSNNRGSALGQSSQRYVTSVAHSSDPIAPSGSIKLYGHIQPQNKIASQLIGLGPIGRLIPSSRIFPTPKCRSICSDSAMTLPYVWTLRLKEHLLFQIPWLQLHKRDVKST